MRHLPPLLLAVFLCQNAAAQLEPQPGERDLEQEQLVPKMVTPPQMTKNVDPTYPDEEKQAGRAGAVVLRLTIDDTGAVDRVDVLESAGPAFDWSALGAATNLEFSPAIFMMQPEQGEPRPPCSEVEEGAACAEPFATPVQIDFRMAFELQAAPEPPPERPPPPQARMVGLLREAGSKRALEGVEIIIETGEVKDDFTPEELEDLNALTDKNGQFSIPGIPVGEHKIRLALSGYEPAVETETFAADQEIQVIYYLVKRTYSKFTTVVRVKRPPKEVTKVALQREEVEKVPGTFGDPLRVIENLPGLARAGAIGGSLLVRGANASDSGVYFDSVDIPILYHFGGLTSVINAEFLEDINFYPGGFGARYGRATAGIVDVTSRDLDMDEFRGTGEVDLLDSGFFFAGPIDIGKILGREPAKPGPSPQKINIAMAARRSYLDALLPFAIELLVPQDQAVLTASPIYWDYQTKVEYRPHKDHKLSLMAFGSDDNLRILARGTAEQMDQEFSLTVHQHFHRIVGRYNAQLTSRISNEFIVNWGFTGIEFGADANQSIEADAYVDIWSAGIRDELEIQALEKVQLAFGFDGGWGVYDLHFVGPIQASAGQYPRIIPNLDSEMAIDEGDELWMPAFYAESRMGPFAGLTLIAGYRFDFYSFLGGEQSRFTAEPRLTARWEVVPGTTLKTAFGIYEQLAEVTQLSEKFGNPELGLPRALHYIVGYEHKLTERLNLSFELYFNDKDRLVVSSNRVTVDQGDIDLEFYNNNGIGRSYGAEVMLRHELSSTFYGWVAYTLSRSESRNADQGRVNMGGNGDEIEPWYVTSFDQTHILTIVGQYRPPAFDLPSSTFQLFDAEAPPWLIDGWRIFSKDWSIGGRFRLVTGDPTTPILFAEHDLDTDDWNARAGAQNTARMPTFNQLDVRIDRKVVFENFILNFYLDLLNAYNMPNVESMIRDYRYAKEVPLTGLPIIPVIGVQGEF